MFDWLGDIFSGIGNLLGDALASLGESISNSIFDAILRWWYEMIYNAVAIQRQLSLSAQFFMTHKHIQPRLQKSTCHEKKATVCQKHTMAHYMTEENSISLGYVR